MTFDLAAWQNEKDATPFEFNIGPATYTLPHLMDVPGTIIEALEANDLKEVFTSLLDVKQADEILSYPLGAIIELAQQWQKHSGTTSGEDVASAG